MTMAHRGHTSLPHGHHERGAHHGKAEVMPKGGGHSLPHAEKTHGIGHHHEEQHHKATAPESRKKLR